MLIKEKLKDILKPLCIIAKTYQAIYKTTLLKQQSKKAFNYVLPLWVHQDLCITLLKLLLLLVWMSTDTLYKGYCL